MSKSNSGFYKKYHVSKISNPDKKIDALVLEFDDPVGVAIASIWATLMLKLGYTEAYEGISRKMSSVITSYSIHYTKLYEW